MNKLYSSRREFLKTSGVLSLGALSIPTIIPASAIGKNPPSDRITIGMIGTGRQAIKLNLNNGFLNIPDCQVVAVNDVDAWRMELGAKTVNEAYSKDKKGKFKGVKSYADHRELVADKSVDAVMVSTTDHWHAPQGIAAALAGKHISMEKALSISYSHSKALIEAIKHSKVANRLDSEFRSTPHFWKAVEIVHNGLIGKLNHVTMGVPAELSGSAIGPQPIMSIPAELDYDQWLGPAFPAPYTQARVHDPKTIDTRPGWLRIDDYCNGMITNWGAHLCDIALWGMKKEYELPKTVKGTGTFSKGLWNTIETFEVEYTYADGLSMSYIMGSPYVKFEGENGWVRIEYPNKLTASNEAWCNMEIPSGSVDYSGTLSDKSDFIAAIKSGNKTLQPLEVGHNVYFTTLMGLFAVKLGRELTWDNSTEQFVNDNAANAMLIRPFREKWLDKNVIDWMNNYQEVILK